jgi:hypothetical protein
MANLFATPASRWLREEVARAIRERSPLAPRGRPLQIIRVAPSVLIEPSASGGGSGGDASRGGGAGMTSMAPANRGAAAPAAAAALAVDADALPVVLTLSDTATSVEAFLTHAAVARLRRACDGEWSEGPLSALTGAVVRVVRARLRTAPDFAASGELSARAPLAAVPFRRRREPTLCLLVDRLE